MDPLFMEPKVHQYGGHMVMTNVSRSRKTKLINIDTRFRENITQVTSMRDIQIALSERINNVHTIWIESMEFPLVIENFSAAIGNTSFWLALKYTDPNNNHTHSFNGPLYKYTIPDGQYTSLANLVAAINAALTDRYADGIAVEIDTATGRIKFVTDDHYEVTALHFGDEVVGTNCGSPSHQTMKRKLGWFLGYRGLSYTLGMQTSIVADAPVDLYGVRYVYLVVQEFSKSAALSSFLCPTTSSSMLPKQVLAKIPLRGGNYGEIMLVNSYNGSLVTDRRQYNGAIDIQKLQLQLVDEMGQPIDLQGFDFSFCMGIECE